MRWAPVGVVLPPPLAFMGFTTVPSGFHECRTARLRTWTRRPACYRYSSGYQLLHPPLYSYAMEATADVITAPDETSTAKMATIRAL